MIVRLWYRPNGATDGLWWTLEIDGAKVHASSVTANTPWRTGWEQLAGKPRCEQKHFIQTEASSVEWRENEAVIHGID